MFFILLMLVGTFFSANDANFLIIVRINTWQIGYQMLNTLHDAIVKILEKLKNNLQQKYNRKQRIEKEQKRCTFDKF